MKRLLCAIVIGLLFVSAVSSQEGFSQVYSLLDMIDDNLKELQNSNESQQTLNNDMQTAISNSEMSVVKLKIIIGEQENLLKQWQNNWQETQIILQKQENLLDSYEKKLNFWRVTTPTLVIVSVIITLAISSGGR